MTDDRRRLGPQHPARASPGQAAGVDAHYYANVVDDFYGDTFGRNSIDDTGMQNHLGGALRAGLLQRLLERRPT